MSGSGPNDNGGDDGALRDAALRRALDHAPDSGARPDPRTRDAIRKMARNLAAAPAAPAANAGRSTALWWRRWFGGGGNAQGRMPWNAAFGTVLVATFVTVLWHREPVPDARLDGEAQVQAEAPPPPAAPAPTMEAAPQAAAPPAAADAPRGRRSESAEAETSKRRDAAASAVPAPATAQTERRAEAMPPPPPPPPAAVAPARAPEPSFAAPPAPAPLNESADSAASPGAQRSERAAESPRLLRQAPAPRAAAVAKPTEAPATTPSFAALDRWTFFDATVEGRSIRQARGATEGLAALLNAVARSATAPGAELSGPVELRIELRTEQGLLAVLEIAGAQARWTPQGEGGSRFVGLPNAVDLAALRAALRRS